MSYTQVTITDYNASAPTDDGASGSANTITWAKIKTKLGDPINTAIASVDDNTASACGSLDTSITSLNSTVTNLNTLLTTALTSLYAPVATIMPFMQTSAPTGWTKITTHNNKALRLVSGTVSTGGSTSFTNVFASRGLSTTELPDHQHTITVTNQAVSLARSTWSDSISKSTNQFNSGGQGSFQDTDSSLNSYAGTISHDGTTSSTGSSTNMDFDVLYVDIILASKD